MTTVRPGRPDVRGAHASGSGLAVRDAWTAPQEDAKHTPSEEHTRVAYYLTLAAPKNPYGTTLVGRKGLSQNGYG